MCLQQLRPTIQGSEPEHEAGLEQTLFDRLMKMVSDGRTRANEHTAQVGKAEPLRKEKER